MTIADRRRLFDQRAEATELPPPGDAFSTEPAARTEPPTRPLMLDIATGRVGELMPHPWGAPDPYYVSLRPVGGGVEWTALACDVRPYTPEPTP